ncbi:O-antigen ligase family protein [Aquimarina sp. 2201CG1-2-11]|uniref:O-antigen ligase family protein n=1 Tax=Aquimarina discodermiae TaxID=3231043 RepID=UPI003461B0FB
MNLLVVNINKIEIRNSPVFFLYLLFFSIPIGGKLLPPLIVFLVISGMIFLKKKNWWKNFNFGKVYYLPLLSLFLLYVCGILWSNNIPNAFKKLEHALSFVIFPILLPLFSLPSKKIFKLFSVFALSCSLVIIISFVDFFFVSITKDEYIILGEIAAGDRPGTVYEYLSKHLLIVDIHRTYFSAYILIAIGIIITYFEEYCFKFFKKIKWLGFINVLILTAGLICLQSKASIAILIMGSIFFLIVKFKKSAKFMLISFFTFLGMILLLKNVIVNRLDPMIEELQYVMAPGDEKEKDFAKYLHPGSTEIRYMLYKSSLQLIFKSPFFGYGTGDVKDILKEQNIENDFVSIAHLNYGPHSQVLYMLVGFGVLGLLVFFSVFIFPFYESFKFKERFTILVLVILFLNCLTESFLARQEGIIPTALFITVLSYITINKQSSKNNLIVK